MKEWEISSNKFIRIKTKVISGRGKAKNSLKDDIFELKNKYNRKYQLGSLNLVAQKPYFLLASQTSYISQNQKRFFWKARLNNLDVLLYKHKNFPAHIFEILSEFYLRDYLSLNDGQYIIIELKNHLVTNISPLSKQRIAWYLLWKFREYYFYKNDNYINFVTNRKFIKKLNQLSKGII